MGSSTTPKGDSHGNLQDHLRLMNWKCSKQGEFHFVDDTEWKNITSFGKARLIAKLRTVH